MDLCEFDYELPQQQIAQAPLPEREGSRLLLLERESGAWGDGSFRQLPELLRGDEVVVCNNARVFPARLRGRRRGLQSEPPGRRTRRQHLTAEIEVLLVRCLEKDDRPVWEALVRPGRKVRVGEVLLFGEGELSAEVLARGKYGLRTLRFVCRGDFCQTVGRLGHIPLPPYINRPDEKADRERYQTVFASRGQAVAAPTAGLHFTPSLLDAVKKRGCERVEITLEVGYGTFQPIHAQTVERHKMHSESYEILPAAAAAIEKARSAERPISGAQIHGGRAAADQLPPAAVFAPDSGLRLRWPRECAQRLRPRCRGRLPLLLLWGLHVDPLGQACFHPAKRVCRGP
jgi:S-adenosylmethionine:tRNA ribosyltransferase-isomerase